MHTDASLYAELNGNELFFKKASESNIPPTGLVPSDRLRTEKFAVGRPRWCLQKRMREAGEQSTDYVDRRCVTSRNESRGLQRWLST